MQLLKLHWPRHWTRPEAANIAAIKKVKKKEKRRKPNFCWQRKRTWGFSMSKSHAPVNPLTPNQSGRKESSVNNSKAGVKETCWDWGYLGVTPHPFQTRRKVEPRRKKALESKLPTISPTHTNSSTIPTHTVGVRIIAITDQVVLNIYYYS